jgi:hypothetical protein
MMFKLTHRHSFRVYLLIQGNGDGQADTNFGKMSAYTTPWVVIPQSWVDKNHAALPGNNIAAVVW